MRISKLTMAHNSDDEIDWIKERDGFGLNYVCIGNNTFEQMIKLFKEVSFKSIHVVKINGDDANLTDLNDLLGLNVIVEKGLCIIVNAYVNTEDHDADEAYDDTLLQLFIVLCQNIIKLFGEKIPIDIQIEFETTKNYNKKLYDLCLPKYLLYFQNEEFLSNIINQNVRLTIYVCHVFNLGHICRKVMIVVWYYVQQMCNSLFCSNCS